MADLTPLPLSDEDLDDLAEVTPPDILRARQAWRRHAPPGRKDLLDAESEVDIENLDNALPLE